MASRKPDLRISMPCKQPDDELRRPTSSLRSPRFHEDFNAPFSEAIMNASRTTISTNDMSLSTQSRRSCDEESNRRPSFSVKRFSSFGTSTSELSDATREENQKQYSRVNDRIRRWARRSWGAVRNRSNIKLVVSCPAEDIDLKNLGASIGNTGCPQDAGGIVQLPILGSK